MSTLLNALQIDQYIIYGLMLVVAVLLVVVIVAAIARGRKQSKQQKQQPVEIQPLEQPTVQPQPIALEEEQPAQQPAQQPVEQEAPKIEEQRPVAKTAKVVEQKQRLVHVLYDRSFKARVMQADDQLKEFYDLLKNKLLSYKGVKSRFSWSGESFRIGRKLYAVLAVKGKTLNLYLAIDPNTLLESKFKVEDASESKKYVDVPTRYGIKNPLRSRYALELIEMALEGIEPSNAPYVDYKLPYENTAKLVEMGLVKIKADGSTENAKLVKADIAELIRSKITVAEADAIVPDEFVSAMVERSEFVLSEGKKGIVNIDTISANFEDGEEVTLEALKAKNLIAKNVGHYKVLARGTLDKKLSVYANDFSTQAIKMIVLTGGDAYIPEKK